MRGGRECVYWGNITAGPGCLCANVCQCVRAIPISLMHVHLVKGFPDWPIFYLFHFPLTCSPANCKIKHTSRLQPISHEMKAVVLDNSLHNSGVPCTICVQLVNNRVSVIRPWCFQVGKAGWLFSWRSAISPISLHSHAPQPPHPQFGCPGDI